VWCGYDLEGVRCGVVWCGHALQGGRCGVVWWGVFSKFTEGCLV
jgi:hypothetical protein